MTKMAVKRTEVVEKYRSTFALSWMASVHKQTKLYQ